MRRLAVLLLWAVPVTGAAQAPPTQPPGPANAPPAGGPTRPAPPGQQVPRAGTLHRFWLHEGDRVRFTEPGRELRGAQGVLVGSTDVAALTVVRGGAAEAIPFTALTRLEVRRGQRHVWKGVLVGALVGAATYLATGEAWDDDRSSEHRIRHASWQTGGTALAGGLVGGLAWRPRWHTVDLSTVRAPVPVTDLELGPVPAPALAGPPALVTLRLRF